MVEVVDDYFGVSTIRPFFLAAMLCYAMLQRRDLSHAENKTAKQ